MRAKETEKGGKRGCVNEGKEDKGERKLKRNMKGTRPGNTLVNTILRPAALDITGGISGITFNVP